MNRCFESVAVVQTRSSRMSALSDTGRSDALRKLELNGS